MSFPRRREDKLFLIQDNSTYLYQYNFSSKNLTLIELVAEAAKSIDKKNKPDFESITLVKNQLQLFGSGSGIKRNQLFSYDLKTGKITG